MWCDGDGDGGNAMGGGTIISHENPNIAFVNLINLKFVRPKWECCNLTGRTRTPAPKILNRPHLNLANRQCHNIDLLSDSLIKCITMAACDGYKEIMLLATQIVSNQSNSFQIKYFKKEKT